MSGSLKGRNAVITGGAKGIGRAMTELFAEEGARVFAVDLDGDALEDVARSFPGVTPVLADISDPAGVEAAIASTSEEIDILVNNAGVLDHLATVEEVTQETWDRVIAVNLTAPFLLCKRAIAPMKARGGGVIVNTASVAGLRGGRAGAAYTASKFGLIGLTQNIAVSHGPEGIRCNAVCPGGTSTEIRTGAPQTETARRTRERDREKPQPGTPRDIAEVALFLAGDASHRINGVSIPVDAGWIAY